MAKEIADVEAEQEKTVALIQKVAVDTKSSLALIVELQAKVDAGSEVGVGLQKLFDKQSAINDALSAVDALVADPSV